MKIKPFAAAFALAGFFAAAQLSPASAEAQPSAQVIETVDSGDTLTSIAAVHSTTYVRIFNANEQIADPDVIHAGETVRVPDPDEVLPARPLPEAVATSAPAPVAVAAPVSVPVPQPAPAVAASAAVQSGVWDRLAQCEASGNWAINTGNGYFGGLQFTLSSWQGVGGSGYPHQASREEQIKRGEMLLARQGWGAWPACASKLGLR